MNIWISKYRFPSINLLQPCQFLLVETDVARLLETLVGTTHAVGGGLLGGKTSVSRLGSDGDGIADAGQRLAERARGAGLKEEEGTDSYKAHKNMIFY